MLKFDKKKKIKVNVSSPDEFLLTEMMSNSFWQLNDLTADQATASLSCFVFQENVGANEHKQVIPLTQRTNIHPSPNIDINNFIPVPAH